MKKIFCIIAFTILAFTSFGQLTGVKKESPSVTIGEVKSMGSLVARLEYSVIHSDTIYSIFYRNRKYQQIIDIKYISFKGGQKTLDQLEEIFLSVFSDENRKNKEYKMSFKLGDQQVIISNETTMGIVGAQFFTEEGYFSLNKKMVNKLFGH